MGCERQVGLESRLLLQGGSQVILLGGSWALKSRVTMGTYNATWKYARTFQVEGPKVALNPKP